VEGFRFIAGIEIPETPFMTGHLILTGALALAHDVAFTADGTVSTFPATAVRSTDFPFTCGDTGKAFACLTAALACLFKEPGLAAYIHFPDVTLMTAESSIALTATRPGLIALSASLALTT
jgi:hypothetical protein